VGSPDAYQILTILPQSGHFFSCVMPSGKGRICTPCRRERNTLASHFIFFPNVRISRHNEAAAE
jgi:hypothetical protein